jgi:hypothetical protein
MAEQWGKLELYQTMSPTSSSAKDLGIATDAGLGNTVNLPLGTQEHSEV